MLAPTLSASCHPETATFPSTELILRRTKSQREVRRQRKSWNSDTSLGRASLAFVGAEPHPQQRFAEPPR